MISSKFSLENLPKQPSLYQVSTRPWLYELSEELGKTLKTLKDIPDSKLQEVKDKGFDFIWAMGVWQIGQHGIEHDRTNEDLQRSFHSILPDYTQDDAIGCPYSITEYVCNKELCPNGNQDLMEFKERCHSIGLGLILDFVPNHSALDSPWVEQDMEYYIRAPKGSSPPYDGSRYYTNGIAYGGFYNEQPWTDVAQLNYWEEKTRKWMRDQLMTIAEHSDGIRCDMAYIILSRIFKIRWEGELNSWGYQQPQEEFWIQAVREVKAKFPGTLFLAEVYDEEAGWELIREGFDYLYDKIFLDRLSTGNIASSKEWIDYTDQWKDHLCHFTENHDDNRAVDHFGEIRKSLGAAMVSYTLPGLKFFFQDQWFGYRNKLDVHLRRSYKEGKNDEAINFYDKFMKVINADTFKNGNWEKVVWYDGDSNDLFGWVWINESSGEKMLCVVNFTDGAKGCKVKVPHIQSSGSMTFEEMITGTKYERTAEDINANGLYVKVERYDGQIFKYN